MLARLTAGERIVLVGGVLLIADLLFLPWHDIALGSELEQLVDTTVTAVQQPYAGYGIAAVIMTAVMIALVLARVLAVRLPDVPLPWSQIHLILGIFVAVVLVVKLVRLTDSLGYGAYSGVLAGLLVAYGGYLIAREPGVAQ